MSYCQVVSDPGKYIYFSESFPSFLIPVRTPRFEYKKRLLLRCINDFKSDKINDIYYIRNWVLLVTKRVVNCDEGLWLHRRSGFDLCQGLWHYGNIWVVNSSQIVPQRGPVVRVQTKQPAVNV